MGEGYPDIRKGGHFFLNRAGVPVSVNGTPGLFDTRREAEAVAGDIRGRLSNPIDNKKLANLLYDNDTYALEKYLRSLPVKELKELKNNKVRVVSTIADMILNEGAVKKPRKSNPLYKPQPSEWNNNWGYTVWVDKNGMTASKQVMGYPNMVGAAQGAYIALQSPAAVRSGNNDRAVLFDRTGINDPKGIISPPNFSKSFTFQELREIVETQSPEFIFKGRRMNPVPEGTRSKIRKATKLYEDFRDQPGTDIIEMEQPDFSTGMVIGRLSAVEYDTVRAGKRENYRHKFKKSASPLLCVTSDGKTLFTVEGGFTFTERGIVDNG